MCFPTLNCDSLDHFTGEQLFRGFKPFAGLTAVQSMGIPAI